MQTPKNYELEVVSVRLVKDSPLMSDRPITNSADAVELLGAELSELDRECLAIICINAAGRPICCSFCSMGAVNQTVAHPREIFKTAILANAASMIILHNHPSGYITPSKEDVAVTDMMIQACELMGIPLLDHIIVGHNNIEYFSFKDKNQIKRCDMKFETDSSQLKFSRTSTKKIR